MSNDFCLNNLVADNRYFYRDNNLSLFGYSFGRVASDNNGFSCDNVFLLFCYNHSLDADCFCVGNVLLTAVYRQANNV